MDEAYELALATEGAAAGAGFTEDQWLTWEETLALAPDLAAKKALVFGPQGLATSDFQYRAALCTLLEAQELLDASSHQTDEKADALLTSQTKELEASVAELKDKSFNRKAARISNRLALLELEVAKRLNKPEAEVKRLSARVATEIGVVLSDPAPANVDANWKQAEPNPTTVSNELISTEHRILKCLRQLQPVTERDDIQKLARDDLGDMSNYARELYFEHVVKAASTEWEMVGYEATSECVQLTTEQSSWVLELFLDEFVFEYTHLEGNFDTILQDIKDHAADGDGKVFGFRKVHTKLSLPQLNELLEKVPEFCCNDAQLALQYIKLMHACRTDTSSDSHVSDDVKRETKLKSTEEYLQGLSVFGPCANTLRFVILHEQLRELLYMEDAEAMKAKLFQYLQVPRSNPCFVKIRHDQADQLVVFEPPQPSTEANFVQPTTALRVDQVSKKMFGRKLAAADDLALIKDALFELWSCGQLTDDDDTLLCQYLTKAFVDEQKAECMVVSGCGELSVWKAKLPRKGEELSEWSSQTEISFCKSNTSHFGPGDELAFFVNVRNVKTLTVQVYEVRTADYYTRLRREVPSNISLDGLLPNEEQRIDLSHLPPWQKSRVHAKLSPNATGRRGLFVVEVFENDTTCRAILRKGYLRHVERVTSRGHEFTVLDERGVVLKDASLQLMNLKDGNNKAQPPRAFHPTDGSGVIVVPFRQPGESASDSFGIVFQHGDFGYLFQPFHYTKATFTLTADLYIDSEQLRPGEEATVLARPHLFVGTRRRHSVTMKELTDIKATINFASVNKSSSAGVSHKVVQSFGSVKELMEGRCTFPIPLDAEGVTVDISARVRSDSSDTVDLHRLPLVKSSKTFGVQRVTQFDSTFTPHFLRRPLARAAPNATARFEYYIAVLGHNGEPRPHQDVQVSFEHIHFYSSIEQTLQTDQNGQVSLGELTFVRAVTVRFVSDDRWGPYWQWELPNQRAGGSQVTYCKLNHAVQFPVPRAHSHLLEQWIAKGLVVISRVSRRHENPTIVEDARLSCVRNKHAEPIAMAFEACAVGEFEIMLRPLRLKYTVYVSTDAIQDSTANDVDVQSSPNGTQTPPGLLLVNDFDVRISPRDSKAWLNISIDQANPRTTQVWVVIKRVLDGSSTKLSLSVEVNSSQRRAGVSSSGVKANEFLMKRKLSDEYAYILQRRAFVDANPASLRLLGASSLPKPTLLQTPLVIDDVDLEELVTRDGEEVAGEHVHVRMAQYRPGVVCASPCQPGARRSRSGLSFLLGGSSALACSPIDADGRYAVCLSDIPLYAQALAPHLELVIVAFDIESKQVAELESQISTAASSRSFTKRDVRLSPDEALDLSTPSMQIQHHDVLRLGQSRTFSKTFSSKYALYETLEGAMDLWAALCTDTSIPALIAQLKNWHKMTMNDKIAFYMKNACDELNVFIYRKDPVFFTKHVRHFVDARVSKSLVDLFILEDKQEIRQRYAHAGVFHKLSVIEKLMVAERAETAELTVTMCQHVIDAIVEGRGSTNGSELSRIFDSVLSQGLVKPGKTDTESTESESTEEQVKVRKMKMAQRQQQQQQMQQQMQQQQQQQQQQMQMQMPMAPSPAYSPTSPAYSPTSPAYSSTLKAKSSVTGGAELAKLIPKDDEEDDFGVESIDSEDDEPSQDLDLDQVDGDEDSVGADEEMQAALRQARKRRAQPYLLPGKVRRLQEKRFFGSQKPHLDGRNNFWKDYAKYLMARVRTPLPNQAFLSSFFPEALRSFTEGILAISVLDLAASDVMPTSVQLLAGGSRVQIDAVADVVLYHQGIGPGEVSPEPNSTLIIKQRLVSQADRTSAQSSDFADIRPAREFIVNRIYTCIVSVSNIGSKRLKDVNLLMQIPRGSIPLTSSAFYTKNEVIEMAPHDTKTLSFDFYFPAVGLFTQYPAHASLEGKVVALASTDDELTNPITVVPNATAVDLTSWSDVATRGSLDDVVSFMAKETAIVKLGLDTLAWRCVERDFYLGVTKYLRQRWVFVESIWKYAFLHSDFVGMREVISAKTSLLQALGQGVHTSVVQLSSSIYHQERFDASFSFDHTEFGPLLSRRAHRVSGKVSSSSAFSSSPSEIVASSCGQEPPRVQHKKAREYYRILCLTLSLRASLTHDQLLVMAYFLILFHRIEDALPVFERAKALKMSQTSGSRVVTVTTEFSIAGDYMDAYLDFFRAQSQASSSFPIARRNVAKYAKLENDRWRERFSRLQEVLVEYDVLRHAALTRAQEGLRISQPGRSEAGQQSTSLAVPDDGEVRLTAEVKGDEVHLTSQNLGACEISFYRIDVELMFSTAPFDSFSESAASKSSLLLIKPYQQLPIELKTETQGLSTTVWKMPTELAASPMLLRIRETESSRAVSSVAAPIELTRSYFTSQLQVIVTKQAGFLQVLHNGLPVPSCYVKAYAKVSVSVSASGTGTRAGTTRSKQTQFYKDGYTDVIGKFDYAAINGDLLTRVEKYSILVSHPKLGTTVQQVAPPVLAVTSSEFKDREAREGLRF